MKITRAMILAAGEGKRLGGSVPKPMVKIGGKPLLEYTITYITHFGIKDFIINVYHQPEVIQDYFGDGSRLGVNITYSLESSLLGTAGGVKAAESFFHGEPFLIWYGDNFGQIDLNNFMAFHSGQGGMASIAVVWREDTSASGVVYLDEGADNRIVSFEEKPKHPTASHWVSAGIVILEPSALSLIPHSTVCDFGYDIFPLMLAKGVPMYAYQMSQTEKLWWVDTPADLAFVHARYGI